MRLHVLHIALALLLAGAAQAQNQARFGSIEPGMKNRFLEQEAVRLANRQAREYQWPEEFYQAKIISRRWHNFYDYDGCIVARLIHIELYAHMRSGHCAMVDVTYKEKLDADGPYSRILFLYDHIGDMVNVECED